LIGFARGLISDPDLPNKSRAGRFHEINHCIACNQGCFDPIFTRQPQTCLVNARAGAEAKRTLPPLRRKKKIMVIGGGPAGMETARVAALRGHDVSLYEKESRLGGQLHLAAIPPGRGEFLTFVQYLETQLRETGVALHLNTEATPTRIDAAKPDAVIVATGARPSVPDIPGVDRPNVAMAWDVLSRQVDVGNEVVIIGGGAVGLETALFLAHKGTLDADTLYFLLYKQAERFETLRSLLYQGIKKVTVVEMLKRLGQDIGMSTRWTLLQDVSRMGIKTLTHGQAKEITSEGVLVDRDGKDIFLPAETVVIAAGARSVNYLYGDLKVRVPEIHLIGDAKSPRKALEAVAEGFEVGAKI
jgi:2,4-dienoyl-CoA reductase (NADPH2)